MGDKYRVSLRRTNDGYNVRVYNYINPKKGIMERDIDRYFYPTGDDSPEDAKEHAKEYVNHVKEQLSDDDTEVNVRMLGGGWE